MQPPVDSKLSCDAMKIHGMEGVFFCTFSSKKATAHFSQNNHTQSISGEFSCCSFTGKEKDEETGFGYFGARYMDHELMTMWLSVDPMADNYPNISPYNYCMWNPIKLVDPDGNAVIPTSALKSNSSINAIMEYAGNNSVFKKVMRRFYSNQQTVYVHLGQLLKNGIPSGRQNLARTQSANSKENPVAKYGMPRIIINSDILNKSEELSGDWTFVFCALLHEGLHAKMYDIRREDRFFEEYPGYKDFIDDRPEDGGHHNLMAVYNRQLLVDGMKEFDVQTRVSHSEEWYEAISWYGLIDTIAWRYFESTNPEKAMRYRIIQSQEIRKLGRE